ncbi:hypothetical protein TNCV_2303481 [Trichonephila clavipes]|nr:hypothetical protein TNCV_2303481 [Trichonephila clavipes]
MKLTEKLISENHRDEFSATSGKPSISPSPLRLTSMHFSDVIPASEKKSNPTRQCSRDCAPVIEIPEISQCKKPHTIAEELILPAAIEIVETMFGDNFAKELQSIPLSNDTVSRRIDDIAWLKM